MITVTYVQLLALGVIPIACALFYEGVRWARRRRLYDPLATNTETSKARHALIDYIATTAGTTTYADMSELYQKGPSYEDHLRALRRGEDVAALYPEEFREFMYKTVYGEDVFQLSNWLRDNKPGVYKEYLRNRAVLKRITK